MAKKRKTPPKHSEIVKAQWPWLSKICTFEFCDEDDALYSCWACGFSKVEDYGEEPKTERAHIIAHSVGGTNDPSNYLLLCHACHREHPDGATFEEQVEWLENHPSWANPDLMKIRYPSFSQWFFPWLSSLSEVQQLSLAGSFSKDKLKECFDIADASSASGRMETVRANRGVHMKRYFQGLIS
jgi:hypothetical protein